MKIAIIDTVIEEKELIKGWYSFEQIIFNNCKIVTNLNMHGTNIANIIIGTCENQYLEIMSLAILDNYKKGTLGDLLKALKFAKEKEVNVINISLGVLNKEVQNTKLFEIIDKELDKIVKNGITVLSAYNNMKPDSYPANNINTIGISKGFKGKKIFNIVDSKGKIDIMINSDKTFIQYDDNFYVGDGNSYLCAKISAFFCLYKKIDSNGRIYGFIEWLESINKSVDRIGTQLDNEIEFVIISDLGVKDELYVNLKLAMNKTSLKTPKNLGLNLNSISGEKIYCLSIVNKKEEFLNDIVKKIHETGSVLIVYSLGQILKIELLNNVNKKVYFIYL